ncbi:DEAD/DEAH box helicase family protein [Dasania marina]|uniref:DEAD/DEAH box helicase family protein n=1 Tax=Dasania marina TaxID=471499 RepID=UPI0003795EDE|nr:DEAD/DEAH box helicase family protein [Dasania marina]
MAKSAQELRSTVTAILNSENLHGHQREAAQKTFEAFDGNTRAVVMAAEMQAGKSGIAMALCCQQRLSLSDEDISTRKKLRDTLYLVTMVDTALLDQAKDDLKDAKNVVVSNFNRFENDLESEFKGNPPKLIIIDECHYGSNIAAVRYNSVFDYLEKENDTCKVIFISATPFGALYAAETAYELAKEVEEEAIAEDDISAAQQAASLAADAVKNSLLRRNFGTKLVFHRTSNEYYGVREMINAGKVIDLDHEYRSFLVQSEQRQQFIDHFNNTEGPGWSLVRVPAGTAMDAKEYFLSQGLSEDNLFILGQSLTGVPEDEQTNIDKFKKEFNDSIDFGEKLIAITVAGCRAGINFGPLMKNNLISTWDSTVASVAAVVQANIGRACGYHDNNSSIHFTNIDAAEAYGATLDYLEQNTNPDAASDFEGLKTFFEEICDEYNVQGLDVGLSVKRKKRKPIGDVETYSTDSYVAVPGKLFEPDWNYSQYTNDKELLKAIDIIRSEYLRDYGPKVKGHRAMRGAKKNWIKAQWVNGDTYNNKEKALKLGTMKERTLLFTGILDRGEHLEYNSVVMPGSGELSENKRVTATIFSSYNMSRRRVSKKVMTEADMAEICDHFSIEHDDTLLVLYKRGIYDIETSYAKKEANRGPDETGTINNETQFSGVPDLIYELEDV